MEQVNEIAKKLHIKAGKRWLFYNAPLNYLATLGPLPDGAEAVFAPMADVDGIQLFARDSSDLAFGLKVIASLLKADTVLWITYPKKSSGIRSDLEMMDNWDEPAKYGLVPVAAASIDKTWTAIRLRPEGQSKASDFSSEAIRKNEYAAFIDVDNRQIRLPAEMEQILSHSPNAMAFYQSLSFSNKKEYVVWILSAKQEKTRAQRLAKLGEKLLAGKKNPSEK